MSENQETSEQSSAITVSMDCQLTGAGRPSVAHSTEIVQQVAEFLSMMPRTAVWHVTLKATHSEL